MRRRIKRAYVTAPPTYGCCDGGTGNPSSCCKSAARIRTPSTAAWIFQAPGISRGMDFVQSALRELFEELGVEAQAEELIFCGQRRFEVRETFRGRPYWDRQVSNVYLLWRDMGAAEFHPQESELESVQWMDFCDCVQMVTTASAPTCIQMEELDMIRRYLETAGRAKGQS